MIEEPDQLCARHTEFTFNEPLASFIAAWKVPGTGHPDLPVLDLMFRSILGGSDSSRMNQTLVVEKELAIDCSASYYGINPFGFCLTQAKMKPEYTLKVLDETLKMVQTFQKTPVTEQELRRAVAEQKMEQICMMQNNMRLARAVGNAVLSTGSTEILDAYLDRIQKVTVQDIERAAQQYFRDEVLTVTVLYPEKWQGRPKHRIKEIPSASRPESSTLPQGQKFVFLEDHALPLVHAVLLFPGGTAFESEKFAGISNLISDCIFTGADGINEQKLNQILDDEAIELYASGKANSLIFRLSCLKDKFPIALDVLKKVLGHPDFPEKPFRREQDASLRKMEENMADPFSLAGREICHMMYQGSPYGVSTDQKIKAIRSFTREDLSVFYHSVILRAKGCCFAFAGDLTQEEAHDAALEICRSVPWSDQLPEFPEPFDFGDRTLLHAEHLEKEQAVVAYAIPGIPENSPDRFALTLLSRVMGSGMSSRLFRTIREERGLAYYAGMFNSPQIGSGLMVFYAGTQAESAEQVAELIEKERKKMAEEGLTQEEFDSAKA